MSSGRQVLNFERPISRIELSSLTIQRDRLVYETICRVTGRTDWKVDDVLPRGEWIEYSDGQMVFMFDGEERLLFWPPSYNREKNEWRQQVEYLYDKSDFIHHTVEDEKG